jgi:hypothetical protein
MELKTAVADALLRCQLEGQSRRYLGNAGTKQPGCSVIGFWRDYRQSRTSMTPWLASTLRL